MQLKSKYATHIAETFKSFGFPNIPIDFQLVDPIRGNYRSCKKRFMRSAERKRNDLSQQALEDFQRREKEKLQIQQQLFKDRPFQLGGVIKNPECI